MSADARAGGAPNEPIDRSQLSYSWADMAGLTHATQVEIFSWCGCEDGERQYDDCPIA